MRKYSAKLMSKIGVKIFNNSRPNLSTFFINSRRNLSDEIIANQFYRSPFLLKY
jgi:DUF1365 family protein